MAWQFAGEPFTARATAPFLNETNLSWQRLMVRDYPYTVRGIRRRCVQRDAYAASGGQAAVIYDNLHDELAVAKQRLSDQEEMLRAAKRGRPKTMAAHGGPREAGEAAEAKL